MNDLDRRPRSAAWAPRFILAACALAGLTPAVSVDRGVAEASARQALGTSADSVVRVTWTLSNGMRALAQHIPDGLGIAISVGYPGGTDQDPAGRGGLATLLAELQFTAAAGEVPERSRHEMASLRPLGADVHVARSFTVFTEVASRAQFYGVLHQVAARMRAVQVTPPVLAQALETVRTRYHDQLLGAADVALHFEVAERACGADDAALKRMASLAGLEKLTARDVAPLLAQAFRPQRAVIAVAGNLEGIDVRAALERELASLPGGAPQPLPRDRPEHGFTAITRRAGLTRPVGVLGIIAPALSDTSHPAFFLASLIMGAQADVQWGEPVAPLTARFQYSVLEEPDLVRFYPPMTLQDRTGEALAESFEKTIGRQDNLVVSDDIMTNLRYGISWLLGGPLNDAALNHVRTESGSLILLSTNMVERELRGGEPFWSEYRARVERAGVPDLVYWLGYMRDPKLQARLIYVPDSRPSPANQ